MALDEVTEKLYRAADANTLLALLPLLRSRVEQARAEMVHFERSERQAADSDAEIAETYGELFATLDARIGDNPKHRETPRGLQDKVHSAMANIHKNDEALAKRMENLFRYATDLMNREHWIIEEMKHPGYLPLFPGEEPQ